MASSPAPDLTVLGSGTLLPDAERSSAAHLVQAPGVRLLLDCGTGTLHGLARHGVPWRTLTHVAITHFHNDHVGDLPALLFALKHGVVPRRRNPLVLVGPPGLRELLENLAAALGNHVVDPGFALDIREMAHGEELEHEAFRLTAHGTPHTEESVAYRWEGAGGVVGYTGDTGPSTDLARFLVGADVLVSECALPDPPEMDLHLSPKGVADLARIAEPRMLVLTHVFPPLTPAAAVEQVNAAGWAGEVIAAHDGLRLPLRA